MLPDISNFRKGISQDLAISLVIVLVGLSAFALGRLSAREEGGEVVIHNERLPAASAEAGSVVPGYHTNQVGVVPGGVVASKSGSKYHYPWCAGARSIKEENKVWFESEEAARKKGYTPASNCKGLR